MKIKKIGKYYEGIGYHIKDDTVFHEMFGNEWFNDINETPDHICNIMVETEHNSTDRELVSLKLTVSWNKMNHYADTGSERTYYLLENTGYDECVDYIDTLMKRLDAYPDVHEIIKTLYEYMEISQEADEIVRMCSKILASFSVTDEVLDRVEEEFSANSEESQTGSD